MTEKLIIHAVMYRDYKLGTLCDSQAWGPATLHSTVTDDVTCPGCRSKLDGTPPPTVTDEEFSPVVERLAGVLAEVFAPAGALIWISSRIKTLDGIRVCDAIQHRDLVTLDHACALVESYADGAFA